jgi:hypothetical protein
MPSIRTLAALSCVALATACATATEPAGTPGAAAKADEHAAHHPAGAASAPAPAGAPMQDRMKAMRQMHDKMMNAKTPEERQALMAEHMKTMQDGMQMMKGMGGGMGGMDAKGMPADMAQRQRMMEARMDMMQMMMDMMMQRMPAAGAAPAAK